MLEAASFSDLLDQLEFLNDIGAQDERIATQVEGAKLQMQETRERDPQDPRSRSRRRRGPWRPAPRSSARSATGSPGASDELATARRDKRDTLATVQEDKQEALDHMRSLQAQSAALAARIRSAQSSSIVPGADRSRLGGGLHLAGARRPHERLRLALGTDARGHRPRRRERHAGRRGRGRGR